MKCRCSNCGWLDVNPSGAMFCGYSDERIWENESCLAWKDKDEPQTNADRIRQMTDEELADFLTAIMDCCGNDACGKFCPMWKCCNDGPDNVEDWLKAPVEEGER